MRSQGDHPRTNDYHRLLRAATADQPYCRITTVADRCDVRVRPLLRDVKAGRELLFVNHEFLDVLTRPE